jgi:hypothetical protein
MKEFYKGIAAIWCPEEELGFAFGFGFIEEV